MTNSRQNTKLNINLETGFRYMLQGAILQPASPLNCICIWSYGDDKLVCSSYNITRTYSVDVIFVGNFMRFSVTFLNLQ